MGSCCCKSKSRVVDSQYRPGDATLFASAPTEDKPRKLGATNTTQSKTIGISTTDPLALITGYEKEPVGSLEEAVKPFDGKIAQLSSQINEAKSKCHFPSEHNLTRDESAAIYLYSMRTGENSVHAHLHKAWDSNDRSQMMPWFKYLKLLKSGLNKLPDAKTKIWQGSPFDENLKRTLESDSSQLYTSMGTCSSSVDTVKSHLDKTSGKNPILVGYQSVNGKDMTGYTVNHENQAMLWPGKKLHKSDKTNQDASGKLTFHLIGQNSKFSFLFDTAFRINANTVDERLL
jgi:hypothetical protein